MTNDFRSSNAPSDQPMKAEELDLLYTLLDPHPAYPWNPAAPENEAYFATLEATWDETGTEAAIASGWQAVSAQLETFWGTPSLQDRVTTLVNGLLQRFSVQVPEHILETLSQEALALMDNGRPLMEQLAQCAQAVLTGWQSEDLEVLARPLAFSLRDGRGEMLDLHLRSLHQTDWSTLSELEKARLSLAIASFALNQAKALSSENY